MEEYYDGVVAKPELDELYHHGILNQKWGVRNGPPYPLSSDVSTGKRLKSGGSGSVSKTKKRLAKASVKAAKANKKAAQSGNKILHPIKAKHKDKLQTKAFKEQAKVDRLQKRLLKEEKREDKAAERRDKMLEKEQRKLSNKDFDGDIDINRFKNDEAYADKVAHDKAKSANLDQGDNYKVYKNAIAGDKEAQKIVNQWEKKAATADFDGYRNPLSSVFKTMNIDPNEYVLDEKATREANKNLKRDEARERYNLDKQIEKDAKQIEKELDAYKPLYNSEGSGSDQQKKAQEKKQRINQRLQNAKTRDQWDLNFLEATQNAPWTEAHTLGEMSDSAYKNKMLTEYKKYLQDPEEYWKRR